MTNLRPWSAAGRDDAAIGEIKRAAIDDGKDIHDHPTVVAPADRPGRLHKALELLRKAHDDVAREEDDPATHWIERFIIRNGCRLFLCSLI